MHMAPEPLIQWCRLYPVKKQDRVWGRLCGHEGVNDAFWSDQSWVQCWHYVVITELIRLNTFGACTLRMSPLRSLVIFLDGGLKRLFGSCLIVADEWWWGTTSPRHSPLRECSWAGLICWYPWLWQASHYKKGTNRIADWRILERNPFGTLTPLWGASSCMIG
jgi:hypothetical protein